MPSPPDHSIEIITGQPGSGKSFAMVGMILDVIRKQKRPVYTNVPLRWRVFKKYLKITIGEEYASLIYELTEEHWKRFLERSELWAKWRAEYKSSCIASGERFRESTAARMFQDKHGPNRTRNGQGELANWIEPWAVIVIDEAHHWHPAHTPGERKGGEGTDLKAYITMHRHHHHDLLIGTQVFENLSVTLRRIYRIRWQMVNLANVKLLGFFTLNMIGVKFLCRACWSKEAFEAWRGSDLPPSPIKQENFFPQMPWYKTRFRLYSSFTNAGSAFEQNQRLKQVQDEAGVLHDPARQIEKEPTVSVIKRISRAGTWAATLFIAGMVTNHILDSNAPEPGGTIEGVADVQSDEPIPPDFNGERINAWMPDRIVIGPYSLSTGGDIAGTRLVFMDPDRRLTVWAHAGSYWVWGDESPEPSLLARGEDLRTLRRAMEASATAESGGLPDPVAGRG